MKFIIWKATIFVAALGLLFVTSPELRANHGASWLLPPSAISRQFPKVRPGLNGSLVVTYIERNGNSARVFVITSSDKGATWSSPSSPGQVNYATIGLQRQPYTVCDEQGILHCLWENFTTGSQLRVFHCRSTDNGDTWSAPTQVFAGDLLQDFSSITVDKFGRVYVTFLMANMGVHDGLQHIFLVRSTDRGVTWEEPRLVDNFVLGGACECCQQNIAIAPNGEVGVAFRSNVTNRRDIFLARSADAGITFSEPVAVQDDNWMINACPSTGPNLMYDDQNAAHVAWRDTRNSVGFDVAYYALVPSGSVDVPKNVSLSGEYSQSAEYPVPAVYPSKPNEVLVVFESSLGVAYGYSTDGGKVFTIKELDETVMRNSAVSVVFVAEGQPLIIWQSERDGKFDLAYQIPNVFGATGVAETEANPIVNFRRTENIIEIESGRGILKLVEVFEYSGRTIQAVNPNSTSTVISGIPHQSLLVRITLEGQTRATTYLLAP